MGRTIGRLPAGLAIVAVLALGQGLVGLLRAMEWIGLGSDLLGRGMLLVPILGALAFLRGFMVADIALLYAAFAWGAFAGHGWAWWIGLVAALLNAFTILFGIMPLENHAVLIVTTASGLVQATTLLLALAPPAAYLGWLARRRVAA